MSEESRLCKYILNNVDHVGHWSQVESHATSAGIPDLDYCIGGVTNWLELKAGTGKYLPRLRPTQCAWFRNRIKAGGNPRLLYKLNNWFGIIHAKHVPILIHAKSAVDWRRNAHIEWDDKIDWAEFIEELKK